MKRFSPNTAIAVVIANMIGTGVFVSLGYQLLDITSYPVLMSLWLVGGLTALTGALCYGELGAALPRSGGEYNYIAQIYHPAAGFISGWISATVGFAAPTALAAMTFAAYLGTAFTGVSEKASACALILVLGLIHATTRGVSGKLQTIFTVLKVSTIVIFCVLALAFVDALQPVTLVPTMTDVTLIFSAPYAVALIYVNYAYSGWNAATYLAGELDDPQRQLPRILTIGTLAVMITYLALNFTFLAVAPMSAMAGELELGYIVARHAFGAGAEPMALVLGFLLISTVSAMIMAGPRVLQVIGEDYPLLGFLARVNRGGVPISAIAFQCTLAILFVLTGTFESVLLVTGFILGLNTFVTIAGLFVLRIRQPDLPRPFRVTLYPLTPIIFLTITGWTLVYLLIEQPREGLYALAIVVAGTFFHQISRVNWRRT